MILTVNSDYFHKLLVFVVVISGVLFEARTGFLIVPEAAAVFSKLVYSAAMLVLLMAGI
jgi:hypothetical protein